MAPRLDPWLLDEINRITAGEPIAKPRPQRDARGRLTRDPRGEWDWYYALSPTERAYISRNYLSATSRSQPDEVAQLAGFDYVDDWAQAFVAAVRGARDHRDDRSQEQERFHPNQLVSVGEIARALGVRPSAVSNWRTRPGVNLPLPIVELACGPIWDWLDIMFWACDTGRLIYADNGLDEHF